jgi:type VI protein secretion system component VasF
MIIAFGEQAELLQLVTLLTQMGTQMTQLQSAIGTLQADVLSLASAVTAGQANQFTPADVANIEAIDTQLKSLLASLTPAPTPTPTPTPSTPSAS